MPKSGSGSGSAPIPPARELRDEPVRPATKEELGQYVGKKSSNSISTDPSVIQQKITEKWLDKGGSLTRDKGVAGADILSKREKQIQLPSEQKIQERVIPQVEERKRIRRAVEKGETVIPKIRPTLAGKVAVDSDSGASKSSRWNQDSKVRNIIVRENLQKQEEAPELPKRTTTPAPEKFPEAPPRKARVPPEQSSPPQAIPAPADIDYGRVRRSTETAAASILGNKEKSGWDSGNRGDYRRGLQKRPETQVEPVIGKSESKREEALRGESFTERVLRQRQERDVNNGGKVR